VENIKKEVEILKAAFEVFITNTEEIIKNAVPAVPAVPAPPVVKKIMVKVMTDKANGMTAEQYITAGWSEAQLLEHGYMEEVEQDEPAVPGVPAVPAVPGAPPASGAAPTMTPEELDQQLSEQTERLGGKSAMKKIQKVISKYNNGSTSLVNLPVEHYASLIADVKKIKK
jgi:hypothetical protein